MVVRYNRMFSRLFRSRWAALFWSAGVVWTAYDIADANAGPPAQGTADATGEAITPADLATLANAAAE